MNTKSDIRPRLAFRGSQETSPYTYSALWLLEEDAPDDARLQLINRSKEPLKSNMLCRKKQDK